MIKERVIDITKVQFIFFINSSQNAPQNFILKIVWNAPEITRSQRTAVLSQFLKNQVSKHHKNIPRQNPMGSSTFWPNLSQIEFCTSTDISSKIFSEILEKTGNVETGL